jgi:hypothetical protein
VTVVKNKQKKLKAEVPEIKKLGLTIILLVQLSTWIFFDGAELGVMFGPQFCGSLRKKFVSSSLLAVGFWPWNSRLGDNLSLRIKIF